MTHLRPCAENSIRAQYGQYIIYTNARSTRDIELLFDRKNPICSEKTQHVRDPNSPIGLATATTCDICCSTSLT